MPWLGVGVIGRNDRFLVGAIIIVLVSLPTFVSK